MPRTMEPACVLMLALCMTSGCTHLMETRTITAFAEAVEAENLQELKATTSGEFKHKALRLDGAMDEIRTLRLPTGEIEVVHVEEESPTRKLVTAEVGARKRRMQFRLTQDGKTGQWLVDDVVMKQSRKDVTAAKSVTEQMDLLLTVREALDAWEDSDREVILELAAPDFAEVLAQLPEQHLVLLTQQAVGQSSLKKSQPTAQMDVDVAVVSVPRHEGKLILTFRMTQGRWKVSDVTVSGSRNSGLASARRMAAVVGTSAKFLEEFRDGDKDALSQLCTESFFKGSLAPADLSLVQLPTADPTRTRQELRIDGRRADVVLEGPSEYIKIGMLQQGNDESDGPLRYLIEEVTIYELESQQEKRLSSVFTAHARMQLFAEALAARQLDALRYNSTADFNRRAWEHPEMTQSLLSSLPLGDVSAAEPRVLSTVFHGPVTEITVSQGDQPLTYMLRDWNGQVLVDDVALPAPNRPTSMKENLEVLLPVYGFAAGLKAASAHALRQSGVVPASMQAPVAVSGEGGSWQETLQRNSTADFNRLAWSQLKQLPEVASTASSLVRFPLSGIRTVQDRTFVMLGDERCGAVFELVKERQGYRVDDILMMKDPTQHVQMKRAIRAYLANYGPTKTPPAHRLPGAVAEPDVQTAEFFVTPPQRSSVPQGTGEIQQIGGETR